jgi:hypothetical protein
MEMNPDKAKANAMNRRIFVTHAEEVEASASRVFLLLCPVAEYDWISGWDCTLVFTASGVNEQGCIFSEGMMGPVLVGSPVVTTWVTTVHDEENRRIQFVIFLHDQAVVRYDIRLEERGSDRTHMVMNFEVSLMGEELRRLDDDEIRARLMVPVTFISESLKHYCRTGKKLEAA